VGGSRSTSMRPSANCGVPPNDQGRGLARHHRE
jgi:hypothetical protein